MASPDTISPTLTGLTLPTTVDVTKGSASVSFSLGALDMGSGIDHAFLDLDHSYHTSYGLSEFLNYNAGTFINGTSTLTQLFDSSTSAGTYKITGAYVYDKAGNLAYYNASQLTAQGLTTSFSVVDRNAAVTASVTAPVSVTEGNDTGIAMSLTLKNVTIASGTVTMAFLPDQSTVTNGADVSVPTYTGSYTVAQSSAGSYTLSIPTIGILDDLVAEGTETLAVRITASGQVFDTGTDSTVVTIKLIDNDFAGTAGNDVLIGTRANEHLTGGAGNDRIDGGDGVDTAVFTGRLAQSSIAFGATELVVTGTDGRDTLVNVERLQFADGVLTVAGASSVGALYATWGGRDATGAELAYWTGQVAAGRTTLAGVKAAILADPLGQSHTNAVVGKLYQDYGGRAATTGELAVWRGLIANGATFDTVRTAILGDPLGATAKGIIELYHDYMDRTPSDGELGVWQGLIRGGATLATVRGAILDDAGGRAHTDATVTQLYRDYGGRAPTAGELTTWEGLVRDGYSFGQIRTTILNDQLGQSHTTATVAALYGAEFGRAPSSAEATAWDGLVRGGATFDTLLDTLIADRGSDATGTQRLAGTPGADRFTAGRGHETVIAGFDALADTLTFSKTDIASGNPLDTTHTRQVFALDGTPDVLFTLDDGHHVLLQHASLAELSAGAFSVV